MQKLARNTIPVYILAIILLLILPPKSTGISLDFHILGIKPDKIIHTIMLIPFMVLMRYSFPKTVFLIPFFFGIFFCSFCETLHYFLPYREFSIYDFYANCTGLLIGSAIYFFKKTEI
ncbi:MAG: VanZ family protein [Flavobacteriia bacterium]